MNSAPIINETKRLFFGMDVIAPWPKRFPKGRLLSEQNRHMTLFFLGNQPYQFIEEKLATFPVPSFKVGQSGYFDKALFLPEKHPHVVAWQMQWLNPQLNLTHLYKKIREWAQFHSIDSKSNREDFLPHMTIARTPFNTSEWTKEFIPLSFIITNLNLYESTGNLQYHSCWSYPLRVPFESMDHTADIAYRIYGESLHDIYYNAFTALAFEFPALLSFYSEIKDIEHLDDIVIHLNKIVGQADAFIGCPFKAISFHGDLQ